MCALAGMGRENGMPVFAYDDWPRRRTGLPPL